MEYCFLKGFLLGLLIQHCTPEGVPTSIQSTIVTREDVHTVPKERELPPAEVVPVVAPPSLKEVQQAVQEASEKVEVRGVEEVLKELLDRVVEAAMGQVEGGSEGISNDAPVQEEIGEDALGAQQGQTEADTVAEPLEPAVEGIDRTAKEEVAGVAEEEEVAEMDVFPAAAEEGKRVEEGETAGRSVTTTTGADNGGRASVGAGVISESLDTEVSQDAVDERTEEELAVEEAGLEAGDKQVVLSEDKRGAETETLASVETPAVLEAAEQVTVVVSEPRPVEADVEQVDDEQVEEETHVIEMEGEVIIRPPDDYGTTQTVVKDPEEEQDMNTVEDPEGTVEGKQGHLVVEGGADEEGEVVARETEESEGGERDGESVVKQESEAPENLGGDQEAGEEEQITVVTSHGSETEDHGPEGGAEASVEQSPEKQAPTLSPSLGEAEVAVNALDGEISDHGNEIITPTDDLLPHDSAVAEPTPDYYVKDVLVIPPQAGGEEPGEADELVEDTAGITELSTLGLEAWKIGAIAAAVFLVLETVVIIIYILKCRNKRRSPGLQRSCEEGCVEPEAATGGDCNDDTLPAGNGDTQQIAALDPSNVASTLAQNKEKHEEEHAITMSDLLPSSAEESANTGPGPDPSQELRTSIL